MKTLTATEARRRLGALLNTVQQEPMLVRWRNGKSVVIVSAERYKQMTGIASFDAEPVDLPQRTTRSRKLR